MEELIQKLQSIHGLSAEQSHGILNTVVEFIKEKFPMVGGAVDSLFHTGTTSSASVPTPGDAQVTGTNPDHEGGGLMDKISDLIPGSAGEKIEHFAKDKLGGLFGKHKKD